MVDAQNTEEMRILAKELRESLEEISGLLADSEISEESKVMLEKAKRRVEDALSKLELFLKDY